MDDNSSVRGIMKRSVIQVLIEHNKEEPPDTNISDTSNGLKQFLVHNCFYILHKTKT